jgi:hypothetical protein
VPEETDEDEEAVQGGGEVTQTLKKARRKRNSAMWVARADGLSGDHGTEGGVS